MGLATAVEFAKRDAHVILACRDMSRAEKAIQHIREKTLQGQMVLNK